MSSPEKLLAGRFRVERTLGHGGMSIVYLAEDTVLGRRVAVKRLATMADTDTGRRIRREARLGASLNHRALVAIFDTLVDDDAVLIVMEHVDGETLADAIGRGPLEPAETLRILRPVADALDHAHEQGIIHRDIKPANILLGRSGVVKLADLGIATSEDVTRITRTGSMVGTLGYVAPEQLEAGSVTPAADVYALAATAFEALSGRRARRGSTPLELFDAAAADVPSDLGDDLPPAVAEVLRRGLARDPARRPASPGALVDELEAALAPTPASVPEPVPAPEPVPPPPPPREPVARRAPVAAPAPSRRRIPIALVGLLVAVAAAVVLVSVLAAGDDPEQRASEPTTPADTTTRERTTTTPATTPPATGGDVAATPDGAVRAFYERAAQDDLDGAWELAGPGMRAQFGGSRERFANTLGSLESIAFERLAVRDRTATTATLDVQTVARHTNRTDRCSGTLGAVRGASGWQVEPRGLRCTRE